MKNKQMLSAFKSILLSGFMIYTVTFIFSRYLVDMDKLKMKDLNINRPLSFKELVSIKEGKIHDGHLFDLTPYLNYFSLIVTYIPNQFEAYGLRGYCRYYQGDVPGAVADYQLAIQQQPRFFWFYYNLGVIYYRSGQYREAVQMLQQALQVDLKTTVALILSSQYIYPPVLQEFVGTLPEGLVVQYRRGLMNSYKMLIVAFNKEGRYQEAISLIRKLMQEHKADDPFFYYHLGQGLYAERNYQEAVKALNQCLKRGVKDRRVLALLGQALLASDETVAGQLLIQKAQQTQMIDDDIVDFDNVPLEVY